MSFIDDLRTQGSSYDLLASQCRITECPIFADLCWGKHLDCMTLINDPGIEIDKGSRRFVLMRIAGEIRYFAGTSDPYDEEGESETGIFSNIASALEFGNDYLVGNCSFAEITIKRNPR